MSDAGLDGAANEGEETAERPDIPSEQPVKRAVVLGSILVDALGSGLWMPFSLLFFTSGQGLPIASAGAALTVGALIGLLAGQLSGGFVDRRGPGPAMLLSNGGRAVSFALYPFAHSLWQVLLLVGITSAADRVFWTANAPLVETVVRGREADKFLGRAGVVRLIGLGLGAAVAGLFAGSTQGLHVVAYINATTFALAAVLLAVALGPLLLAVPGGAKPAPQADQTAEPTAPRSVWHDRAYLALCLVQVVFVLAASAFVVIIPVVISDELNGPKWLAGVSIVLGNIVMAVLQTPVLNWAEKRSRGRMLMLSVAFYLPALLILAPGRHLGTSLVVPVVLLAAALAAVGEVISAPLMIAAANESAPQGYKGRYSAVFQTGWGLANVLAPLVYTLLLSGGNALLWVILGALTLLVLPALARLRHLLPVGVLTSAGDTRQAAEQNT
jgi:MFS family permease